MVLISLGLKHTTFILIAAHQVCEHGRELIAPHFLIVNFLGPLLPIMTSYINDHPF